MTAFTSPSTSAATSAGKKLPATCDAGVRGRPPRSSAAALHDPAGRAGVSMGVRAPVRDPRLEALDRDRGERSRSRPGVSFVVRNVMELPAARPCGTSARPSIAISSSVSRQSAVKPGQITSTRRTPSAPSVPAACRGVGLEPLRRRRSATGRTTCVRSSFQPELRGDEPRGLRHCALVGIAPVDGAPAAGRGSSSAAVGAAVLHPVVVDVLRHRLDVGRVVVEVAHDAQLRRAGASCAAPRDTRPRRSPWCSPAYCGIERQHQHAVAAALAAARPSPSAIEGLP